MKLNVGQVIGDLTTALRNETFVEKMNNMLLRLLDNEKETDKSPMKTWEQWKVEIKNLCIEFGKELSCSNRNRICQLQGQLKELDEKITDNPKDERAQASLLKIKHELEVIQIEKTRGAQIRARIKWIEEGEKNTRFFCNLEKSRRKKNTITCLKKKMEQERLNKMKS